MANSTLTVPVTGMHCASCALLIQKTVKKLPGVQTSDVNYGTEQLRLSYDPEMLALPSLEARVRDLGYGLILPAGPRGGACGRGRRPATEADARLPRLPPHRRRRRKRRRARSPPCGRRCASPSRSRS